MWHKEDTVLLTHLVKMMEQSCHAAGLFAYPGHISPSAKELSAQVEG